MVQEIDSGIESLATHIRLLRGQRVLLDSDLAALYGVETRRLNEQIRRNAARFPEDFVFQLTAEEQHCLRSQNATLNSSGRGQHRKYLPYAFTEHGSVMAAMVLNSPRAVEVSVFVVRAFIRLRELAATHQELAQRLAELEEKSEALSARHDALAHNTRAQLQQILATIRQLTMPQEPARRPIGFVTPSEPSAG